MCLVELGMWPTFMNKISTDVIAKVKSELRESGYDEPIDDRMLRADIRQKLADKRCRSKLSSNDSRDEVSSAILSKNFHVIDCHVLSHIVIHCVTHMRARHIYVLFLCGKVGFLKICSRCNIMLLSSFHTHTHHTHAHTHTHDRPGQRIALMIIVRL